MALLARAFGTFWAKMADVVVLLSHHDLVTSPNLHAGEIEIVGGFCGKIGCFSGRSPLFLRFVAQFHGFDAHEGVLLTRLVDAHPVEARFVNEVRVGSRSPTSIAYTLIEDEIERLGVGPLSVGEGIAVGALGRASHKFAIHIPRNERGRSLHGESVVAAVVDVATLHGRRGILLVLEREGPVRV